MKVGNKDAPEVGFWWARYNYDGKLTVIKVVTFNNDYGYELGDDDWNELHAIVMWKDHSETIDDLIKSPAGIAYDYVFIERIPEPTL
jgi:hypothetical protein